MFVTRSYGGYSSPREQRPSGAEKRRVVKGEKKQKPKQTRGFGWRPASYEEHSSQFRQLGEDQVPSPQSVSPMSSLPSETLVKRPVGKSLEQPEGILAREISSSRSHPLEIPHRTSPERAPPILKRGSSRKSSRVRQEHAGMHDPRALPPSVAALLAMTSIPKKKVFPPTRPSALSRSKMSSQDLVEQWKQLDLEEDIVVDPTMELLLSPPRPEDMLARALSNESLTESFSRSRSCSTESMDSLEGDTSASWSLPSTPASPKRVDAVGNLKDRAVLIPTSIDSVIDHPLLPFADEDSSFHDNANSSPPRSPSPPTSRRRTSNLRPRSSSTRSALSLSLKALRSAARSFSNFAAPSLMVLPDDHLSRGLFPRGPSEYPSEMRPKPLEGLPTAEMRRYMNPSHCLAPGDFHLHGASWDHVDLEAAAASGIPVTTLNGTKEGPEGPGVIKLQTYIRTGDGRRAATQQPGRPSSVATSELKAVSPFAAMEPSSESGPGLREAQPHTTPTRPRREARENADFLRVCVLEMNMRRMGKLEAVGVGGVGAGRARFWLPPRTDMVAAGEDVEDEKKSGRRVPKRWIAVGA